MTVVHMEDRIHDRISRSLSDLIPEHEYLEWQFEVATEPYPEETEPGVYSVAIDHFLVLYLSIKEPEDGVTLNARVCIPLTAATDENIETLVKDTWDSIQLERMETQFHPKT